MNTLYDVVVEVLGTPINEQMQELAYMTSAIVLILGIFCVFTVVKYITHI